MRSRASERAGPGRAAVLLSAGALAACGVDDFTAPVQPESWTVEAGARWRPLAVAPSEGPGFTAVPPDWSGVGFANRLEDASVLESQMRTNGSGVAVGDVDGDGRADLYFARLDGPNVLYRNLGDWRFEDVTEASGLAAPDRYCTGAVFADIDADGDLDLLLNSVGDGKLLFLNDGEGRFAEAPDAGLAGESGAMSHALADVDGDGDLDLYITNYKRRSVLDLYPPQERDFASTVERGPGGASRVRAPFEPHYELSLRGGEVRRLERAEPDELYLNDGSGRFELADPRERFLGFDGSRLEEPLAEWGLAARFADLDLDGDPDLYVANDLHSPDRLWLNRGDGTFREIGPLALRTTSASSMAVDVSDVERDGDVDIFTIDMLSRSSRLRKTQDPVARIERPLPGEAGRTQQVPRNALLLARGDATYAEVARYAGVEASDWSWSALFVDVDLDGLEDLLVANGHIGDLMDADTQMRVQATRLDDWRQSILLFDPLPLANVAFRNLGGARFEEVGEAWGIAGRPDISHGMALADLDGDGDLDAVVNRLGDPALLLRNETSARRLAVRLAGRGGNPAGAGARIAVDVPGLPRQAREIALGGGYLSGSEPLAVFAMGDADSATVDVAWRGGARSRVAVGGGDRLYEIREPAAGEGAALPAPAPARTDGATDDPVAAGDPAGPGAAGAAPWFALDPSFGPLHDEPLFDEWSRQPLLPFRLSQLGPQLAWSDLDGDAHPELVIGSGAGAAPAFFRNEGGTLVRATLPGPRVPVDQTAILPLPSGDGPDRLAVGLSSYEAPGGQAGQVPGAVALSWEAGALGGRTVPVRISGLVPGAASATGPLAAADVNGDGRLDLLVAGRVRPGRYPEPAGSRLFLGTPDGRFELDTRNEEALRGAGLVSGALFSDVDVDGDPDLVLAVEWGPVRVFRNEGGRLVEATRELGLADRRSRWNALASGDFDGDGRPDLVATSWGENTEYEASATRPLEAYYGDVDRNGTLDVVEARHDPRIGAVAPLVRFGRLAAAIPSIQERIESHAEYADASLEEILDGRPEGHLEINTLAHTLFLNRGDRFEASRLPEEAQWAPSFGIAVADADGDGSEDLFLSQNFFATDEDSPRYDAGRGLWLKGDGRGGFEAVPADVSGVAAYGDQRGAAVADVDGDGRVDLAVGQNGGEARLYRNVSARPGLRVRLEGAPGNPRGIGASIRVLYDGRRGPAREVRAGSGTGSHDDPVQVLGLAGAPTALEVRWPGSEVQRVPLEDGRREVTVVAPEAGGAGAAGGR